MTLRIDPQIAAALAALPGTEQAAPAVGDVATRRRNARRTFGQLAAARPPVSGVEVTQHRVPAVDGTEVPLRWYRRIGTPPPGSAALYLHGGGMIFGLDDVDPVYDSVVRGYVAASGVPMLAVDYRVAPEFPHPVPVGDCYAGLRWLAGHHDDLGVDPARVAVMGDSAGGGLAACVCLLARDRGGPPIAQQILVYPMLDETTSVPNPALLPYLTWSYDDNVTGWGALLGAGADTGASHAAAARAADLAGLPPAYLDVGELDIFCDEVIAYAGALARAGVGAELHVHPGCPHAFDLVAPGAAVSRRAIADRVRRLASL